MNTLKKRITAFGITLAMVFSMLPLFGSGLAVQAAEDFITVYLTVSNAGELAKANDGSPMAWKEVLVGDLDGDGKYTYDEALTAAHAAYNSADGYAAPDGFVSKLWGVETYNTLFFINDKGIPTGVTGDYVQSGDFLTASINADSSYYSDFYTTFNKKVTTAKAGEILSLTLTGYMGMSGGEAAPIQNAALGFYNEEGVYTAMETETDENGIATVSFSEPGIYMLSADGSVEAVATDWNLVNLGGDPPIYGIVDWTSGAAKYAYTETDYGNGPYPADEIKYRDYVTEEADTEADVTLIRNYPLHSQQVITDAPLIAPCCTIIVSDSSFKASADGKELVDIEYNEQGYQYYDWNTMQNLTVDLFTITIPEGTETVDLSFSGNVLAYNYDSAGNWLAGYYEDYHTGADTAAIQVDSANRGILDFVQVQTPYYPDPAAAYGESSDMLYAITFHYEAPKPLPFDPTVVKKDILTVYQETSDKVASLMSTKDQAVYGNEWLAMDLSRDFKSFASGYYLQDLVATIIDKEGVLHTGPGNYTNYAKAVLTLTSMGVDATKIAGYDLTQKLMDFQSVSAQGINGIVFALLALDSSNYPITSNNGVTRETFINAILDAQLEDGGWDYAGKAADPDMTALAVQALAPYFSSNNRVQTAIEKALQTLSALQQPDGGFQTADAAYAESSESTSMVILALLALDIDPTADARFIKNGTTTLDNLCSFAVEGGGFKHVADGSYNGLATDQGYRALVGYMRKLQNWNSFYNMTDLTLYPVSGKLTEEILSFEIAPKDAPEEAEKIENSDAVKKIGGKIDALYAVELRMTDGADIFVPIHVAAEKKTVELTLTQEELSNLGKNVLVVGVHDGELIVIEPTSVDRTTGKVTFETDLFSVYSIVSGNTDPVGPTPVPPTPVKPDPSSPKTGDSSNTALWIILLAAAAIGGTAAVIIRKRSVRR